MKKYVITESQLKTIIEKYEPVPPSVANAAPLGFEAFMDAVKQDNVNNQTGSSNKDDLKSFVAAQMASSRAGNYMDKADDALMKIAGDKAKKISMATRSYGFKDDNVLAKAEDLTVIVLSLLYYFHKEGKIDHNIKNNKDVSLDYNTIYNGIKKHGVDNFKWMTNVKLFANWFIWLDPNDDTQSIISSENATVQVHVDNATKKTKLVSFANISPRTLDKFYNDVLNSNQNVLKQISGAIRNNITPRINSGSLDFMFK